MGRGPSIEARKNASDAKRGKIFTKIIREIGVAARGGGGDPNNNPRLRVAVDKGLAVNMSKDVIERAIKKATGELEGVDYEEIRYEGYAPGGVAVIVDCLTDNRVRTVADVRHAFSKCGGNMGTEGSVAFMFKRLGVLSFAPGADEEAITEAAIEAGADDIVVYPDDGSIDVVTSPDAFNAVKDAMAAAGHVADHAEITFRADNDIKVEGEVALQVKKLLDMLQTEPGSTQRVVLIDFPHRDMKSVGLVTRVIKEHGTDRELAAVYVPTTPNPTSGYLEIVPVELLTPTDWTVDQAMSFIISGGAVAPSSVPFTRAGERTGERTE